jgi:predicted anti-sigma-YlaC factor YlaD
LRNLETLSLSVLLVALAGCSIKKMAVRTMADALADGGSTYATDDDPELIREALPFGLKTLEGLLQELPRHRPLLRSLCSGFTSYAAAYIAPEIRPLELTDLERARAQRLRARRMFLRARDYGLRALETEAPNLRQELLRDPKAALGHTDRPDVPDLYWTAAAWGSAISVGKDQMDLVADANLVEALIRRALELDETYEDGAIHEFLIIFESRGEASGGSLERARRHFDRAMELGGGRKIGPLVALAENVSIQNQDRAEFVRLLEQALAFDPDSDPANRLVNLIQQRQARRLLDMVDEYFLEESTE